MKPSGEPVYWVVVPFPSREMAEIYLGTEVDGYRANIVKATPGMIQLYIDTPHPDDIRERSKVNDEVPDAD